MKLTRAAMYRQRELRVRKHLYSVFLCTKRQIRLQTAEYEPCEEHEPRWHPLQAGTVSNSVKTRVSKLTLELVI